MLWHVYIMGNVRDVILIRLVMIYYLCFTRVHNGIFGDKFFGNLTSCIKYNILVTFWHEIHVLIYPAIVWFWVQIKWVKYTSVLFSQGPKKAFLVPDSFRMTERNGNSISADITLERCLFLLFFKIVLDF
jgi:hypothetical protein